MDSSQLRSYEQVNDRLKEILLLVEDERIPLDEALGLFEEAVQLGMRASTLLEEDIVSHDGKQNEAPDFASGADAIGATAEGLSSTDK